MASMASDAYSADTSDLSDPSSTSPPKAKRGRSSGWVWGYFKQIPGTYNSLQRRWSAQCALCPDRATAATFKNARPATLRDHLTTCKGVTPAIRRQIVEKSCNTDTAGLEVASSNKKAAIKAVKQSTLTGHVSFLQKLDDTTRRLANTKLVLFAASRNIPFAAFDDQPFFEFCQLLCKDYMPPGAYKLRYELLNEVYQQLVTNRQMRLEGAQYITLVSDFWTNSMNRGVFGCLAVLDDRSTHLLQALDVSDASHTGVYIKERLKECVDMAGIGMGGKLKCVESVGRNEAPLRQLVGQPNLVKNKDVKDIINNNGFWRSLPLLSNLLEPASKVVMAIQADAALLGDVPRYWAYMARVIEDNLEPLLSVPEMRPFAIHVAACFDRRSREMDTPYLRLALFLDPRFKTAVHTVDNYWGTLLRVAVEIAKRRGYSMSQCIALRNQLVAYNAGVDGMWGQLLQPGAVTPTTTPVSFWTPLRSRVGELADLALMLHSIPPHAAGPERLFSAMGWFEGGKRACLCVDTNAKLATIKMHVDQQQRKHKEERERHAPEGDLALDVDDATAEEVEEELARIADRAGWVRTQLPQVTRASFTSLLFGAWYGFDMRAACLSAEQPTPATEPEVFVAAGHEEEFTIDDVLTSVL